MLNHDKCEKRRALVNFIMDVAKKLYRWENRRKKCYALSRRTFNAIMGKSYLLKVKCSAIKNISNVSFKLSKKVQTA